MRTRALLLGAVTLCAAAPTDAQIQAPADARLVSFLTEPLVPEFGEVYDLLLTIRVAPDVVAFMPDTLIPSDASFSTAPGHWTLTPAPADSIDVRGTYPVVSLLAGGVYIPSIEVLTRAPGPDEAPGVRPASDAGQDVDRILIPTGGIQILTHGELSRAEEEGRVPRPPADVIGGEWSLWLVLATALAGGVVGVGMWLMTARWRHARSLAGLAPEDPRQAALMALDRIREEGWHTDGRMAEFYEASTGALRRFTGQAGPDWGIALTSSELVHRLGDRWGADAVEDLSGAVWVAERVKFGSYRPSADAAERDWGTIRDWIARAPESR